MAKKKQFLLDGHSRLVAIFGWPLSYTLSPVFQNAALRQAGLNAAYLPLATETPAQFRALARGLMASPHFVGANITNPFKAEALLLAQSSSPAAKAIGAANTLARQGSRWVAHNTDAPGFVEAARAAGVRLKGARVLILGAGGVARAIAWAVASAGAVEVAVLARRPLAARDCAKLAKNKGFGALLNSRNLGLASQAANLVVNTLPGAALGGSVAAALSQAQAGAWAIDVNYLPRPSSPFLLQAKKRGFKGIDGLPMLAAQGGLAFKIWFGKKAPKALVEKALRQALG